MATLEPVNVFSPPPAMSAPLPKPKGTTAAQNYLLAYNAASALLWTAVLGRVTLLVPLVGITNVFGGVDDFVRWVQTLALAEVAHAAFGEFAFCFVRACVCGMVSSCAFLVGVEGGWVDGWGRVWTGCDGRRSNKADRTGHWDGCWCCARERKPWHEDAKAARAATSGRGYRGIAEDICVNSSDSYTASPPSLLALSLAL